jgi:integrase
VLSDDELVKVWNAAEQSKYADAIRLLILTGARREEIGALRWDEVADGAMTLKRARTKTGEPRIISLSAPARSILDQRKRDDAYVFGLPITHASWARHKETIAKGAGLDEG